MKWLEKLEKNSPFSSEVTNQLKLQIQHLKELANQQYFKLRQIKRNLRSEIHEGYLRVGLDSVVCHISLFQA